MYNKTQSLNSNKRLTGSLIIFKNLEKAIDKTMLVKITNYACNDIKQKKYDIKKQGGMIPSSVAICVIIILVYI